VGNVVTHRSASFDQGEIIDAIEALYVPGGFDADCTYGNGAFWKNRQQPRWKFDIQPLFPDVIPLSSCDLPFISNALNSLMFDPPFLTYVRAGRDHKEGKVQMTARFGGYWTYQELTDHYFGTIACAARVLKKGGHLCRKVPRHHP